MLGLEANLQRPQSQSWSQVVWSWSWSHFSVLKLSKPKTETKASLPASAKNVIAWTL